MAWPNRWPGKNKPRPGNQYTNQGMWSAGWGMPQAVAVGPKGPKPPGAPGAAPGAPQAPGGGAVEPGPSSPRESASDVFRAYFQSIGMTWDAELEGVLIGAMQKGYGPDQIDLIMPDIENTQTFKTRFPGYHARKANGYNAISIARYLELEDAYQQIMASAGLPTGFYDDHADFGQWIAKNVAPEEIAQRVSLATDAAKRIDPTMRDLMARFYGLTTGDVASYFLDPNRALPVIEHQYKSAGVASWAARNGYKVTDMTRYERLMTDGVTMEQAAQGYGTVKALDESVGKIAEIYGESYGQDDAEQDVFFNKNEKRRRIVTQERATFSGQSAGVTGSSSRQSY